MSFEQRGQDWTPVDASPLTAPTFHAATFHAMIAGNDAFVLAHRLQPNKSATGELNLTQETVAVLNMSVGAFKDLSLLLVAQVAEYERKTGRAIETDYTRSLAKS